MPSTSQKTGRFLAKALGIKLETHDDKVADAVTRGESVFSIQTSDTFVEPPPTAAEWVRDVLPSGPELISYTRSLFPFTYWIGRYNLQWLFGDLVAGITIGAVVVPQSMAYAGLAQLAPQFGLYSSFMGVLVYWFFATSKDITIGPVAVMSTIVGNIVLDVRASHPELEGHVVASALAVVSGAIIVVIGLARCGWIVELISLTAISAFMTGSAISIAAGQVPTMMGISFPKPWTTRDPTYLVIIHTLQYIGTTTLDAAMGLTAMTMLYIIRAACNYAGKKWPSHQKAFFFVSTLRTAFVILLYTLISYLVNRNVPSPYKFKILGDVPRGFQNAAVPVINSTIISSFASQLPATVIVLLLEHIAISKSFGRVNNYVINPSQELVAIGVTNLLGPFLGAYPATGSFSRTAIKAKAGVRTPFAGVITALVVLLAIYALPALFFWIPNASLAGVIIHAVGDLITPPNTIYQFWLISPLEVIIFFIGVIVTVFTSIENGIYCTIGISFGVLFFRVMKAHGRFLGQVKIRSVAGDNFGDDSRGDVDSNTRTVFLPYSHDDGSNPNVEVQAPYPGIFIYRFSEGFNYPNVSHYLDELTEYIFAHTNRTNPNSYPRPGDRPWNDPGPRRGQPVPIVPDRPNLKAIILDFSSVNNVDITSVQQLIDVRNQLDKYASPEAVDWHFASINNRWTKRALVNAGFGYPPEQTGSVQRWKPIFSVAEIGGSNSRALANDNEKEIIRQRTRDAQTAPGGDDAIRADSASSSSDDVKRQFRTSSRTPARSALLNGLNRPLFHLDLTGALESAIANIEARNAFQAKGGDGIGEEP